MLLVLLSLASASVPEFLVEMSACPSALACSRCGPYRIDSPTRVRARFELSLWLAQAQVEHSCQGGTAVVRLNYSRNGSTIEVESEDPEMATALEEAFRDLPKPRFRRSRTIHVSVPTLL